MKTFLKVVRVILYIFAAIFLSSLLGEISLIAPGKTSLSQDAFVLILIIVLSIVTILLAMATNRFRLWHKPLARVLIAAAIINCYNGLRVFVLTTVPTRNGTAMIPLYPWSDYIAGFLLTVAFVVLGIKLLRSAPVVATSEIDALESQLSEDARPLSVTITSWIVIAFGAATLISLINLQSAMQDPKMIALAQQSALTIAQQQWLMAIQGMVILTCGIGLLCRKNAARYGYVAFSALMIVVGLFTSPIKLMLIPGVLILATISFFLFRPQANAYFLDTPKTIT